MRWIKSAMMQEMHSCIWDKTCKEAVYASLCWWGQSNKKNSRNYAKTNFYDHIKYFEGADWTGRKRPRDLKNKYDTSRKIWTLSKTTCPIIYSKKKKREKMVQCSMWDSWE